MKKLLLLMTFGLAITSLYAKEFRIPIQNKLDYDVTLDDWKDEWETNYKLEPNFPLTIKAGQTKMLIVEVPEDYYRTELPGFSPELDFRRQEHIVFETTRKAVIAKYRGDGYGGIELRVFSK